MAQDWEKWGKIAAAAIEGGGTNESDGTKPPAEESKEGEGRKKDLGDRLEKTLEDHFPSASDTATEVGGKSLNPETLQKLEEAVAGSGKNEETERTGWTHTKKEITPGEFDATTQPRVEKLERDLERLKDQLRVRRNQAGLGHQALRSKSSEQYETAYSALYGKIVALGNRINKLKDGQEVAPEEIQNLRKELAHYMQALRGDVLKYRPEGESATTKSHGNVDKPASASNEGGNDALADLEGSLEPAIMEEDIPPATTPDPTPDTSEVEKTDPLIRTKDQMVKKKWEERAESKREWLENLTPEALGIYNELVEIQKRTREEANKAETKYREAITDYYRRFYEKQGSRSIFNPRKWGVAIQGFFGLKPKLTPEIEALHAEVKNKRERHVHTSKGLIDWREQSTGEKFHDKEVLQRYLRRFDSQIILKNIAETQKLQKEAMATMPQNEVYQRVSSFLKKHKTGVTIGRMAMYGTIGLAAGGVVAGGAAVARIGGGILGGMGGRYLGGKMVARAERIKAEKTAAGIASLDVDTLNKRRDELVSAFVAVEKRERDQRVMGVVGAMLGGMGGSYATTAVGESLPSIEPEAGTEPIPAPRVPDVDYSDPTHAPVDTEATTDSIISTEVPKTEVPKTVEIEPTPNSDSFEVTDQTVQVAPEISTEAPTVPSAPVSETESGLNVGSGVQDEALNRAVAGEGLDSQPVAPAVEEAPQVDTAPADKIYEVKKGDNFWDLMEGDRSPGWQPETFKAVPAEHKQALIDLLRDKIDSDEAFKKEAGFTGKTADFMDIGDNLNMTKLDAAAREIAVEKGWLSK